MPTVTSEQHQNAGYFFELATRRQKAIRNVNVTPLVLARDDEE
jgi:hypothetical protein